VDGEEALMKANRVRWAVGVVVAICALAGAGGAALAASGVQWARNWARAEVARYAHQLPKNLHAPASAAGTSVDQQCFSKADNHINPKVNSSGQPTNPAWIERDVLNQYCATLRLRDQYTNRAYGYENATQGDSLWLQELGAELGEGPQHIHGGITTLVPGSQGADPMRNVQNWERRTGGTVIPVSFASSDGAVLRGNVWMPPPGTPTLRNGHYPGVVITDGSVQAYQQLYYWAAEGLAQYGYEVMTYDVQGQGDSDLLPNSRHCGASQLKHGNAGCQGVPYQQNYNFYQGAEDSLNFFLSSPGHRYGGSYNPGYRRLDAQDVGIAGHSLGAAAVSWVSQCDKRVKAVVAWDDLLPVKMKQCQANVHIAKADRASRVHAPALATTNDYEFNIQPQPTVPNPNGSTNGGGLDGTTGYLSLIGKGVDSEIVSIRNGTHLTYSYVPYVLPANEIGERVAFYYTLAWFDEYLRHGQDALLPASDTAYHRLTNLGTYDQSADYNDNTHYRQAGDISFGTGTYSATRALAHPTNPDAGNVPYEIKGIPIQDTLSFYYYSEYSLHDPQAGGDPLRTCTDMLAGCPAKQPATP
jgi:alpha-beta hydrolase superfamily lysophospholipase